MSVLLRAPSTDGDVFFKCSADLFRREAAVTRDLARLMPDLMPQVIAVDERHGWMLMRDLGAAELGEQEESLWAEGVVAHAGIQRSMLSRADELVRLGFPVRSLLGLAAWVEQMSQDTALLERMAPELRERWLATSPTLVKSCLRLEAIGPGPTLVHGDFHPWNVVYGPGTTRVFDWSDAAVSHPFVDLATYVFRTRDISVRHNLVDAYLAAWSTEGSAESLREAAALGLVVGALYQVQTYRALLPTLMANGADDDMADADLDWINRALTRHEQGLESAT
jgi:aminoglycoside/choline kinase family phosphotransferase